MQSISVVLTESNYNQWRRSLFIALSSELKFGFVDGTCAKPVANSSMLMHWMRCNDMIISWILILFQLTYITVLFTLLQLLIWIDLEVRFAQSNVPKLFNLRKELSHLEQGSLSISGYFTKFRTISDKLDSVVAKPRCNCTHYTCHANSRLVEMEQNVQLSQFLMGLNDSYTAIHGQILLMKP